MESKILPTGRPRDRCDYNDKCLFTICQSMQQVQLENRSRFRMIWDHWKIRSSLSTIFFKLSLNLCFGDAVVWYARGVACLSWLSLSDSAGDVWGVCLLQNRPVIDILIIIFIPWDDRCIFTYSLTIIYLISISWYINTFR